MHFTHSRKSAVTLLISILVATAPTYVNANDSVQVLGADNTQGVSVAQSEQSEISEQSDQSEISEQSGQSALTENAWFSELRMTKNTVQLVKAIADSEAHGLNPASYYFEALLSDLKSYREISKKSGSYLDPANFKERKLLEATLYKAFEQLSKDLGTGSVNAMSTQPKLDRIRPKVSSAKNYQRLIHGRADVKSVLTEITPSTPYYAKLVNHMRILLDERDSGVKRTPVSYSKDMIFNRAHSEVIYLRKRLNETGDLENQNIENLMYDVELKEAVYAFQNRNGLEPTGEPSKATMSALNATVDNDIEEIAMNLERWRWLPRDLGEQHILVNIPAYNLMMKNGSQKIIDMNVVVGSKKHQTPTFSEDATFIEVSPSWWIPEKIVNNELIPLELRRPGYLDSKKMDYWTVIDNKLVPVPRSEVTDEDYKTKPFPYRLRQPPGEKNVLGRLKILMPNRYAVYMHDTQDKDLFAKTDRAFSHGCIRLSDPEQLAKLLFELNGMTSDEASDTLAMTETKRVALTNAIPTHIGYFTAWIDDEGKLQKRKDVYKYNKKLIAKLHSKKTLLSTLDSRVATNAEIPNHIIDFNGFKSVKLAQQ